MPKPIIGVMSPGDMGHGIARIISDKGYQVNTVLAGRSDLSKERATRAHMEDVEDLAALVAISDIIFSIMPPEKALGFAGDIAGLVKSSGRRLAFVDCNAISPDTTLAIQDVIEATGATFINAGIIGPPPGGAMATNFYTSGEETDLIEFLDGDDIKFAPMGPEITKASAIKMCYAALTKGMMTLHTSTLVTGELLGISEELQAVIADSQQFHWQAMNKRVPFYAADAGRWAGEMDQISQTFGSAGMTPKLHAGAADVFRMLDKTPLSEETRETLDKSRTLQQAIDIYAQTIRLINDAKFEKD